MRDYLGRLNEAAIYKTVGIQMEFSMVRRDDLKTLIAENESLRKDAKYWSEAHDRELEWSAQLIEEREELRKALSRVYDSLEREYWSEYAGLDETRAILDAAISSPENPS